MRKTTAIALPIAISIIIRVALLLQAQDVSYGAYDTLVHVKHIVETGLPLTASELAWGGAQHTAMPLYHYLLAFFSTFFEAKTVALILPNILISLTPIPVYLLATQITKNKAAIAAATTGSILVPLYYQETLLTATPYALAIPLLLLSYYYFLRLRHTPRYQVHFLATTIALTLTHPISLLLAPAMGLTLLLSKVQHIRFSRAQAEATIFTTFLVIWANMLVYKHALQNFGLKAFWINNPAPPLTTATIVTLVGLIPLLAGTWAAFTYLTKERNEAGHALAALAITTVIALLLRAIPHGTGTLLLSLALITLTAGAIQLYQEAKHRSRTPRLYTALLALLALAFLATTAAPAVALGIDTLDETPGPQEHAVIDTLNNEVPDGQTILWNQENGRLLHYYEYKTPWDAHELESPTSQETITQLRALETMHSDVSFIETLNEHDIDALITDNSSKYPLSPRCFTQLHDNTYEVYELRCVVR